MTNENNTKLEKEARRRVKAVEGTLDRDSKRMLDYINEQLRNNEREEADQVMLRARRNEILKPFERKAAA